MLSNVAYRIPLHHHHHPPRCLARHPQTTSNFMCRPSLSLTLLTNSIQRHTGPDVQLFANAFNGQVRLEAPVCDNIACGRAHLATQSTPQQHCVSTQCMLTGELFLCCGPFLFTWYFYFFLLHLWRYTAVYTVKQKS